MPSARTSGYIFLRGEYTNAFREVTRAIADARQAGYLGENILASGFQFDIELFRGAGAYVCGEETAFFEAIEGKRGLPRMKPPFPTSKGLFNQPTVINNVETLSNIPSIINLGSCWLPQAGNREITGDKVILPFRGCQSIPGFTRSLSGSPCAISFMTWLAELHRGWNPEGDSTGRCCRRVYQ